MDRKKFIQSSCSVCAMVMVGTGVSSLLTSCASLPIYKGVPQLDIIHVPMSSFVEGNLVIVRNNRLPADILLVKNTANQIHALEMKCTHHDFALNATTSGLYCTLHGSTFDLQGNVTKEPALESLKRFKVEVEEQEIKLFIHI